MRKVWFLLVGVVIAAVLWQGLRGTKITSEPVNRIISGERPSAPGFEGGGMWLNSQPLVLSEVLQKSETKAVLVDFWTYSCINCQRTIPYLKSWWEKYKDKGLVIVGVHSPEFEFEKDTSNVQMAIDKYGVEWPVVQDNEMAIWRAYKNNYWPRKYLINKEGKIVYDHIGEGGYEETEREIQKLIEVNEARLPDGQVIKVSDEVTQVRSQTPELYMNKRRGVAREVELVGEWNVTDDYTEAKKEAKLKLEFQAGEVNLVMSGRGKMTSIVDGEQNQIEVKDDDLYNLWKGEFGKHILEMNFDEGIRIHAFTFGK